MTRANIPGDAGGSNTFSKWHLFAVLNREYLPFKLNTAVGIARRNTICNMHIAFYDEIGML